MHACWFFLLCMHESSCMTMLGYKVKVGWLYHIDRTVGRRDWKRKYLRETLRVIGCG